MSSTATMTRTDNVDVDMRMQTKLERKYGVELMNKGFTCVPNKVRIMRTCIGLTKPLYDFWETVVSYQSDEHPAFASIDRIASDMDRCHRSVERYIRRLEQMELLQVIRGQRNPYGTYTNQYDFSPMYQKINALYAQQEIDKSQTTPPLKPPVEPTDPVLFVGNGTSSSSAKTTKLRTKQRTPITPNEESKKDYIQEDGDSNSSNSLKKEGPHDYKNHQIASEQHSEAENEGNEGYDGDRRNNRNRNEPPRTNAPAGGASIQAQKQASGQKAPKPTLPMYARELVETLSFTFNDGMHATSNVTQAARIFEPAREMGLDEYQFGEMIYEARGRTSKASIENRTQDGKVKRMPYFFKVLREIVGEVIAAWQEEDRINAEAQQQQRE